MPMCREAETWSRGIPRVLRVRIRMSARRAAAYRMRPCHRSRRRVYRKPHWYSAFLLTRRGGSRLGSMTTKHLSTWVRLISYAVADAVPSMLTVQKIRRTHGSRRIAGFNRLIIHSSGEGRTTSLQADGLEIRQGHEDEVSNGKVWLMKALGRLQQCSGCLCTVPGKARG